MKFEYTEIMCYGFFMELTGLNFYGSEGWELVAIIPIEKNYRYIFKRQKKD